MNEPIKNEQPSDLELFSACCTAMVDIYHENPNLVTSDELQLEEA